MTTEATSEQYLVLGGSGFLGSHIVEALVARGEKNVIVYDMSMPLEGDAFDGVTYIKGDVSDEEHLYEVLQEVRYPDIESFIQNNQLQVITY